MVGSGQVATLAPQTRKDDPVAQLDLSKLTIVDAPMPKQSRTRVKGTSPFTEPLIETYRESLKLESERDPEKISKKVGAPLSTIVPPGMARTQSELEQVRSLIRKASDDIEEVDGVKMANGLGCQTVVERIDDDSAYLHFRGTRKREFVNPPGAINNPAAPRDNGQTNKPAETKAAPTTSTTSARTPSRR